LGGGRRATVSKGEETKTRSSRKGRNRAIKSSQGYVIEEKTNKNVHWIQTRKVVGRGSATFKKETPRGERGEYLDATQKERAQDSRHLDALMCSGRVTSGNTGL